MNSQLRLFPVEEECSSLDSINQTGSYRAIRHRVIRYQQSNNDDCVHHPIEKREQIQKHLNGQEDLRILELFAGQGNLSDLYAEYGTLEAYDKKMGTGDSFIIFHRLIAEKRKYDIIDLDPYGFPSRFFPDIFLLLDKGLIFLTFPKPFVNILNGITQTHHFAYYGQNCPTLETIQEKIVLFGLCHWRKVEIVECIDIGRLWRMVLSVEKVKATEYTGVKNR